jgi:hypothetical protein
MIEELRTDLRKMEEVMEGLKKEVDRRATM